MNLVVEARVLDQIRTRAESGYPLEICGFLFGSLDLETRETHISGMRPANNQRDGAAHHRYLIEPGEYRQAECEASDAGTQVVGIYHSHPDAPAEPSRFDLAHAWPNQVYIIVAVGRGVAGDVTGWMLSDNRQSFDNVPISDRNASRSAARLEGATCQNS